MHRQHVRIPVAGIGDAVATFVKAPDLADGPPMNSLPHGVTIGESPHLERCQAGGCVAQPVAKGALVSGTQSRPRGFRI